MSPSFTLLHLNLTYLSDCPQFPRKILHTNMHTYNNLCIFHLPVLILVPLVKLVCCFPSSRLYGCLSKSLWRILQILIFAKPSEIAWQWAECLRLHISCFRVNVFRCTYSSLCSWRFLFQHSTSCFKTLYLGFNGPGWWYCIVLMDYGSGVKTAVVQPQKYCHILKYLNNKCTLLICPAVHHN